jgi:serine/threonine-protein kinase HipA
MIDVYVNQQKVGTLSKEGREYVFTYHTTAPALFVSLTMPVRERSYVFSHDQLHPIFNQYIPEGYLLELFRNLLSKQLGEIDELKLLAVLAPGITGRLTFVSHDSAIQQLVTTSSKYPKTSISVDTILHSPEDVFEELIQHFLFRSAIGGVQPKVLATLQERVSLPYQDYIIKTSGDHYPFLTVNEYFCLRAAQSAGCQVPEVYLSDNQKLLVIKRFTANHNPAPGFEEVAVLLGKTNRQKYEGSYEQVARAFQVFTAPQHRIESLEQLFRMMVLMVLLRNGDAHLKNFGLLYTTGIDDAHISPVYDLVTTTCYLPRDIPALTLNGNKRWWTKKQLCAFGERFCLLLPYRTNEIWEQCIGAVEHTKKELQEYTREHPIFRDMGERILHQWQSAVS